MSALVPSNVDLRDFAFMPVDVHRLLTSETWVLGSGDERAAAMTLWLTSWHQVPAGSIPDNSRMLAHLSMAKDWEAVHEYAMRGWVSGGDGRLYHPVVAEKVLEAWLEKLAQRLSSGSGNAKRWETDFNPEPIERDMAKAREMLAALNPHSKSLTKRRTSAKKQAPKSHQESGGDPNGMEKSIPSGHDSNPDACHPGQDNDPVEIPSRSQETGTEKGQGQGLLKDQEQPPLPLQGGGSLARAARRAKQEEVPAQDIIAAFRQLLPNLAAPRANIGPKRELVIRKALKLLPEEHRKLGAFKAIFAECAMDNFLNGTGPYTGQHENFRPTFDFILREDQFVKVYEKAMHRREQIRQQQAANSTHPQESAA